jgi:hypothetical protein
MRKIWWTQRPNRRISVENPWEKKYIVSARKTPLIFFNLGAMRFEKMKKHWAHRRGRWFQVNHHASRHVFSSTSLGEEPYMWMFRSTKNVCP